MTQGKPGLLGGLALWFQKGVMLVGDNPEVDGILGREGSVDSPGDTLSLDGVLYSGEDLDLGHDANLDHISGLNNMEFMEHVPWVDPSQDNSDQPLYSNVTVMLVE